MNPPPNLPEVEAFMNATKKKRGRENIGLIDRALAKWKGLESQPGALWGKKKAIAELVGVCRYWLNERSDKALKGVYAVRKPQVELLGAAAYKWLRYLTFESNKFDKKVLANIGNVAANAHYRGTVPLQPGYTQERAMWDQTKAAGNPSAISMSKIHSPMAGAMIEQSADPAIQAIWNKEFSQMTVQDVIALNQVLAQNAQSMNVWYMPKRERMDYMLVVQDGHFYSGFNERFTMKTGRQYVYAINAYGNVFIVQSNVQTPQQDSSGYTGEANLNHSTLNAGREVVCAGVMSLINGVPCIDNNSGHYKPNRTQMHNAICMLAEEGLDLAPWYAGVVRPDQQVDIFYASQFRLNVNVAPPLLTV
jgi:hypothetical protein